MKSHDNPASPAIKNKYTIRQKIQLGWWLVRTKLLWRKARLIRFPFDLGGGFIDLETSLTTGVGCRIEAFSTGSANKHKVIFGANVQINDYVHISAIEKVVIGDSVLIASHVYISDNSHGSYKGGGMHTIHRQRWLRKSVHTLWHLSI